MKKVCVVTSTRADYGILKPLLHTINNHPKMILSLVATGMHLSPDFGYTYSEIEEDGFVISRKIETQLSGDLAATMNKTMGLTIIGFSDYFQEEKPDLLILLGDRYEIMAVATVATNMQIPIAHIHGGEVTQGAVDEAFRHSITKMSMLHFTSCEIYRKRVIQLGEQPNRVFNVGALGIENILKSPLLTLGELNSSLELEFELTPNNYCLVTFHPVTLEDDTVEEQVRELILALKEFPELKFIVTKANADAGGRKTNLLLEKLIKNQDNMILVTSLGMKHYLSALKYSAMVIGNSSSGILEGPASKIPTIDIGDRQKGRIKAESVISCEPNKSSIVTAMKKGLTPEFQAVAKNVVNPYGDGDTSEKIIEQLEKSLSEDISIKKEFYDIEFEV